MMLLAARVMLVAVVLLCNDLVPAKVAAQDGLCPEHCKCDESKGSMRCTRLRNGLPEPAPGRSSFFESDKPLRMLIVHRAIFLNPNLVAENFSHPVYANLVDVAFVLCNLESIGKRTFERLEQLSRLVFKYNNKLTRIEPEAFFGLGLQLLEFHECPLLSFGNNSDIFKETRTNKLVISKSGLKEFSYNVFQSVLKISMPMSLLNLRGNYITTISDEFSDVIKGTAKINFEDNPLLCIEQNYWIFSLFRKDFSRFNVSKFHTKPQIYCTRPESEEVIYFIDAEKADFTKKSASLISDSDVLYEVKSGDSGNPSGRSVIPDDYEEPIDATIPGERNAAGKRLVLTSPWGALLSTLAPDSYRKGKIVVDEGGIQNHSIPISSEPVEDNTDTFLYILIIAGSVSFLSIIIGVVTSVRRAVTWPRHKSVSGVDKNASTAADKALQSDDDENNDKMLAAGHHPVCIERMLSANNSADTALSPDDCIVASTVNVASDGNRCFEKNNNSHLYSTLDRKTVFINNSSDNRVVSDRLYLEATNRCYQQHHSSNSTSPLLSTSPRGSSNCSSSRSPVLLGPLPPPTKVIRFADMESDEC